MQFGISAVPTFIFFRNKAIVERIQGADKVGLESAVVRHAPPPPLGLISGGEAEDESAAGQDVCNFTCGHTLMN